MKSILNKVALVLALVLIMILIDITSPSSIKAQAVAPFDPFDHLKCYQVRDSLFPDNTFDLRPFQEEFGLEENCSIVGRFRLFCIPVAKENVAPAPQNPFIKFPVNSSVDRVCYQIKCEGSTPPDLEVTDQFGTRTLSNLNPHLICTPAFKGEPLCGDGVIVTPPEECDDGNTTNGDGCQNDCTEEICGDGILDPGEECDDGNTTSGDGCSADCTNES